VAEVDPHISLKVGSGSRSHDLFGDLVIISLTPNFRSRLKHFEHISIKHNICIHGYTAGIIWGIRNELVPGDSCFTHEKMLNFSTIFYLCGVETLLLLE